MDRAKVAAAFNEWMRLYTEHPEDFDREFQSVGEFLEQTQNGETPSYGETCAAFLEKLIADADQATAVPVP